MRPPSKVIAVRLSSNMVFDDVAGLAPAAAFLVNQFGYVGSGFGCYFLFPIDPAMALRASSFTLMALCSVYLVLAALAWVLFAPVERARLRYAAGQRRVRVRWP